MAFLKCAMVAAIGTDVSSRFHPAGTIELHGGCGSTGINRGRTWPRLLTTETPIWEVVHRGLGARGGVPQLMWAGSSHV